mmetsp:Transcript_28096/g.66382  ORF Transcript_28096/g.66382 Transcript_28096/m.66382 type:complete len:274 (+) Transcript_28096:23-844(+)
MGASRASSACRALRAAWSTPLRARALVAASEGVSPQHLERAWRSFYGVEMSLPPGGMRLYEMFVFATIGEVRKLLEHEFGSLGGSFVPAHNLSLLLRQGLEVRLHVFGKGGEPRSLPLHDRLRFRLSDGGVLRFRLCEGAEHEELAALRWSERRVRSLLTTPTTFYEPMLSPPGDRHTLESICHALQVADETADLDGYAAVREQLGWELSVDTELPLLFQLPSATGWPARPPQRPLVTQVGYELEYGHNDIEGLGDSEGEDFWDTRYNDEYYM